MTLTKSFVYFVLDLDRVLFDTERLYKSRERKNSEEVFSPYSEDKGALEELEKLGTICIFSEITKNGSLDLQRKKISKLGLDKRVAKEHTHIKEDKISQLRELFKRYRGLIFLIDDRIEVLEEAKRIKREERMESEIITVWIQRGTHAKRAIASGATFLPNSKFPNLKDFVPFAKAVINSKRFLIA